MSDGQAPEAGPATRVGLVLTWAPPVLVAAALCIAGVRLARPLSDPDTYWHLRLGRYLLETGRFSGPEPWSAYAQRPLVLHEWPLQVLYAQVWERAGTAGLVALGALGPLVLLVVLYACTRRVAPPLPAALVALLAWLGASDAFALRPQVVSIVLLPVLTVTWLAAARDLRARWWVIPLTGAWAAAHGMWVAAAALGVGVLVGMVLDAPGQWRALRPHALVLTGSLAAAALTPIGPALLLTPATMAGYAPFVTEWSPPSVRSPTSAVTVGLLVLVLLVWARGARRPTWAELAVWGMALVWTLLYSRTVALGAVMTAPLAAAALSTITPRRAAPRPRTERLVVLTGGVLATALVLALAPAVARESIPYPAALESRLDALPTGTGVLNEYVLGGWLLWAHPDLDPYVDGRADVYTVEHFRTCEDLFALRPGWEEVIRRDALQVALLRSDSPLSDALQDRLGWRAVAQDQGFVLLQDPGAG